MNDFLISCSKHGSRSAASRSMSIPINCLRRPALSGECISGRHVHDRCSFAVGVGMLCGRFEIFRKIGRG